MTVLRETTGLALKSFNLPILVSRSFCRSTVLTLTYVAHGFGLLNISLLTDCDDLHFKIMKITAFKLSQDWIFLT